MSSNRLACTICAIAVCAIAIAWWLVSCEVLHETSYGTYDYECVDPLSVKSILQLNDLEARATRISAHITQEIDEGDYVLIAQLSPEDAVKAFEGALNELRVEGFEQLSATSVSPHLDLSRSWNGVVFLRHPKWINEWPGMLSGYASAAFERRSGSHVSGAIVAHDSAGQFARIKWHRQWSNAKAVGGQLGFESIR